MNVKLIYLFLCLLVSTISVFAQNPSALIEIQSNEAGFLPPRMITSQRDAIANPTDGMIIFNSGTGFINYFDQFRGWLALEPQLIPPAVNISQTMFIGGSEFRPAESINGHVSSFGQGGSYITTPGEGRLVAGIPLPVGTLINSVTFYFRDNDPTSMMSMEFDYESMTSGTFSTIMEYNTTNAFASSVWQSQVIFPNHTLISNRAYRIDVYSVQWDGDMVIKGAQINYTLPNN